MAWTFGSIAGALIVLTISGVIPPKVLAILFLAAVFVIGPMLYSLAAKFENWRTSK